MHIGSNLRRRVSFYLNKYRDQICEVLEEEEEEEEA